MNVNTQSCSGKNVASKPRQNPQKTPAKEPILQQSRRLEACNLTKKEPAPSLQAFSKQPTQTLRCYLLYFRIPRTPIFRTPFNDHFCSKYRKNFNISLVKN